MQRHLVSFRYGITTGEAVELAEDMGISITRQTVRNMIGSGFLQNICLQGDGWYQIDPVDFTGLLEEWRTPESTEAKRVQTSGPVESKVVQISEPAVVDKASPLPQGPYHVKRRRREIPTHIPPNRAKLERASCNLDFVV